MRAGLTIRLTVRFCWESRRPTVAYFRGELVSLLSAGRHVRTMKGGKMMCLENVNGICVC